MSSQVHLLVNLQRHDLAHLCHACGLGDVLSFRDESSEQLRQRLLAESQGFVTNHYNDLMLNGVFGQSAPKGWDDAPADDGQAVGSISMAQLREAIAAVLGEGSLIENAVDASTRQKFTRLADAIDKRLKETEGRVAMVVDGKPLTIEVAAARGGPAIPIGLAHKDMPTLLQMATAGVNIMLVGPAGSGKTTAAEQVARALGLAFHFNGAIDTEYKLKGFRDAGGTLHRTAFREAFEHGGVYLFDELDASLPAATMAFNAALANGWCDFPDGRVTRHKDFICMAAGNTFLGGATFEYVGRNKQDAAFADRFVFLEWNYDEALEKTLCGNEDWAIYVQSIRRRAADKGIKVVISPRASIEGAKLLRAGLPRELVIKSTLKKGMSKEQWDSLR